MKFLIILISLFVTSFEASAQTHTFTGKISSTFSLFSEYNNVQVDCTTNDCVSSFVASDGTYSVSRNVNSGSGSKTFTELRFNVINKFGNNVTTYNASCNDDYYNDGNLLNVYHSSAAGTYEVRDFVFHNLDIKADSISGPKSAKAGSKLTLKIKFSNVGDATVSDAFSANFYLLTKSDFSALSSSKWKKIGAAKVYAGYDDEEADDFDFFEPGQSRSQSIKLTIPKNLKAGTYYLGMIIDRNRQVSECYRNDVDFNQEFLADNNYIVQKKKIAISK